MARKRIMYCIHAYNIIIFSYVDPVGHTVQNNCPSAEQCYIRVWIIHRAVTPSLFPQIHSHLSSWREDLKETVSFTWCFILLSVQYQRERDRTWAKGPTAQGKAPMWLRGKRKGERNHGVVEAPVLGLSLREQRPEGQHTPGLHSAESRTRW